MLLRNTRRQSNALRRRKRQRISRQIRELGSSLSPAGGKENAQRYDEPGGEPASQGNTVVDATRGEIADRQESKIGRDRLGAGEAGFAESGIVVFGADDQQRDQGKGRKQRQDAG